MKQTAVGFFLYTERYDISKDMASVERRKRPLRFRFYRAQCLLHNTVFGILQDQFTTLTDISQFSCNLYTSPVIDKPNVNRHWLLNVNHYIFMVYMPNLVIIWPGIVSVSNICLRKSPGCLSFVRDYLLIKPTKLGMDNNMQCQC